MNPAERHIPPVVRVHVTRCAWCKRFRADNGHWFSVGGAGLLDWVESHMEITHSKCWDCQRKEQDGQI